ncbi:MAG: hypothetical protein PVH50_05795, partial [Anaerolineae bacterium]
MRVSIVIVLILSILVTSCGIAQEPAGKRGPGVAVSSEKERLSPEIPEAEMSELVEGNSTFAFDLYRVLV